MKIHHYHPQTGECLGAGAADPNPLEPGEWLVPAHATPEAPPEVPEGLAAVWQGEAWALVEDHRGRRGWLDGEPAVVADLGPLPAGWRDTAPEPGPEALAAARLAQVLAELTALDAASARPLRAVLAAQVGGAEPDPADLARLADLEAQAQALRAELVELGGEPS